MKPEHGGFECPECGGVFLVLQVAWPYTGEWQRYMPPRHCPQCGAKRKDDKGRS